MLCLAGRGVRRSFPRRLRQLSGKWLGGWRRLLRLGLWWKRRLRQREVRSGGCGGGWCLEPSSARAARAPGDSGMEGSLPRPPVPRVPASDPPSRPLDAAQPDSPPSGPGFHPGHCRLPRRRCEGPAPLPGPLIGTWGGGLGVGLAPKGKGRPPPCPWGPGWSLYGRWFFSTKC